MAASYCGNCDVVELLLKENASVNLQQKVCTLKFFHNTEEQIMSDLIVYHCKKLEVDLTQENVISVALWIHHGSGSGPPPVAMVKGYAPFPVKHCHKI